MDIDAQNREVGEWEPLSGLLRRGRVESMRRVETDEAAVSV
jgi:hypothetical protein